YPVQTWSFGSDLAMVFLGGEVVVDYAQLLRRDLDPDRLWITAYANDVPCYIPSKRILQEGGYEGGDAMVWYDLPARLTPETQDLIVDEVKKQLGTTFASTHDSTRTGGSWPRSPQAALDSIVTHPELRVELVAAEPLIRDPVAIDFGPDGRLWVAQMHDYPEGLDGQYQPGGSVQVLRDTDGDGKYDTSETFLDQLPFPTDVKVWRDGVLICTAPNVLFARDTDGDGKADDVRTILSGFETHNYQARVNSLAWGLDHWVYGAAGIFGGHVKNAHGQQIDLSNRDFRLRPDTGEVMSASGRTQQGRVRDDWGNWFGCDNSTLLVHYPAMEHYSARQPTAASPPQSVGVAQANRLFPPSQIVQWALSGPPGLPTSACGLGMLRSPLLGDAYAGNTFTCEPVNQLVHRLRLIPSGVTFQGHRAANEQDREFLWSTDRWFRPVQVKTGLDGSLYVVDMYRFLIEHPRFLTDEVRSQIDVRAGQDRGRIYRVVPRYEKIPPPASTEDLTQLGVDVLAQRFDTPNGTLRDLIHQMLWWSYDPNHESREWSVAIQNLQRLVADSTHAAVRCQALSLLSEWKRLPDELLTTALQDPQAQVRRTAVRVSEVWLRDPARALSIGPTVAGLASDPDPQVRLQVAYSLGEWRDAQAAAALNRLLDSDGTDAWIAAAVQSSLHRENIGAVVTHRLERLGADTLWSDDDRQLVRQALRMPDVNVWQLFGKYLIVGPAPQQVGRWQLELWSEVLDVANQEPNRFDNHEFRTAQAVMLEHVIRAVESAEADVDWQVRGLELLGHAPNPDQVLPVVQNALRPQAALNLQLAALKAWSRLARPGAESVSEAYCQTLPQWTPRIQAEAVTLAQNNPQLTSALLKAVVAEQVPQNVFDASARQFFLDHPTESVRQLAGQVFSVSSPGQWKDIFPQYLSLNVSEGRPEQGQLVFRQYCAACHRVDDFGHAVGPDLRALTDLSATGLLASILDPHAAMDARYAAYIALTNDGQVITGMMEHETTNSVTLVGQEGKKFQLLRNEIEDLRRTGKSLMPEGLEKDIPPVAMRDLLRYLGAGSMQIRYHYVDSPGPHANYPDSQPPHKLIDRKFGTGHFNDGQWLSFYHVGQPAHRAVFEFEETIPLSQIRVTYGVNHRPGVIHAPRVMRLRLFRDKDSAPELLEVTDWDDTPDGLGIYQIERRHKYIQLATVAVGKIEIEWESDFEWTSFAEIEFNPVPVVERDQAANAGASSHAEVEPQMAESLRTATGFESVDRILELVASAQIGTPDEYRVIPDIWREAIAAGKRNDPKEIRAMLEVSLPEATQPLFDWQSVVIGGGMINGISQTGIYPGPRIEEILSENSELIARWIRSLELAAEMADHEPTPQGTRYDALRMVAMRPWHLAEATLLRYLAADQPHELQMGSVSGLVDVPNSTAALRLHEALGHLPKDLRAMAVDGLTRPHAKHGLRAALAEGLISREALHPSVRDRLGK
ncbi:MAG: HEAT repeat domain-containing protein, partial [Pirellulaceae bacterium]|nr:HEAT repeat domain-containing protein [Pirellulaceae bacterium]